MTKAKRTACRWIDENRRTYEETARYIWENPELSLVEFKSSEKLQEVLRTAGFKVVPGVSGMPTAFVASWGSGKPLIGFLAEFDALPNLSQKAGFTRQSPVVPGGPGHGCGHNLLGASSCVWGRHYPCREDRVRAPAMPRVHTVPGRGSRLGLVQLGYPPRVDGGSMGGRA